MSEDPETTIFWYHPNFSDERRAVENEGNWAVFDVVGKGFLPVWYDSDGNFKAPLRFFYNAEEAKEVATRMAKRVSRRERLWEVSGIVITVIAAILFLFGAAILLQRYGPEPDPSSVPQFHGENR